jgi:hypothetical protein
MIEQGRRAICGVVGCYWLMNDDPQDAVRATAVPGSLCSTGTYSVYATLLQSQQTVSRTLKQSSAARCTRAFMSHKTHAYGLERHTSAVIPRPRTWQRMAWNGVMPPPGVHTHSLGLHAHAHWCTLVHACTHLTGASEKRRPRGYGTPTYPVAKPEGTARMAHCGTLRQHTHCVREGIGERLRWGIVEFPSIL